MATTELVASGPGLVQRYVLIAAAGVFFLLGLFGFAKAAWGYGLFLIATILILGGVVLLALYFMTRSFPGETLRNAYPAAFVAGGWCYIFAVAALAGYYTYETLAGRMELHWILFGPAILAALIALDIGLYRTIYKRNEPTLQRYAHLMSRENMQPEAMRTTFVEEVILHKSLLNVSPFRWIRHQLILWGFGLMFAVELVAVVFRDAWPAFGFRDIWRETGHPLRSAFDFAYDFTGLMILLGCIMALVFRIMVNGKPEQKYTDTPTAVFLLVVVLTGFILEGLRLGLAGASMGDDGAQFVGQAFAGGLAAAGAISAEGHSAVWYIHMFLSVAFIAYVPAYRLVHSCATPIGRLMNSQKAMLALKKERSIKGLLQRQSFMTPRVPSGRDTET